METNETKKLKDELMSKIRSHELGMHPKYYFMLRIVALVVVSVATLIVSIFILNFILFSIRINSQDVFLGFGPRGIEAFLTFFPWDLFVLDAVLIVALLWLLRQFSFGYKSPLLYMMLFILALTASAGFAIDRISGVNEHFLREADEHHLLPPIGEFYGRARRPLPPGSGVCRACVVLTVNGNTLTVSDTRGTSTTVRTIVLPQNNPRATTTNIQVGDTIFVAGEVHGDSIEAFGIHKMEITLQPPGF